MYPETPVRTTSGTEPPGSASTGVPQAIASTITRPKGSLHWIGNNIAIELPSNSFLICRLAGPIYCTSLPSIYGLIFASKYGLNWGCTSPAIFNGMPVRLATSIARCVPLMGAMRPMKLR